MIFLRMGKKAPRGGTAAPTEVFPVRASGGADGERGEVKAAPLTAAPFGCFPSGGFLFRLPHAGGRTGGGLTRAPP